MAQIELAILIHQTESHTIQPSGLPKHTQSNLVRVRDEAARNG